MKFQLALLVVVVLLLANLLLPTVASDVIIDQGNDIRMKADESMINFEYEIKPSQWVERVEKTEASARIPVDAIFSATQNVVHLIAQTAYNNICNQTAAHKGFHDRITYTSDSVFKFLRSIVSVAEFFGVENYFNDAIRLNIGKLEVLDGMAPFVQKALKVASTATTMHQLQAELSLAIHEYVEPEKPEAAEYITSWIALLPKEIQC